MGAADAALRRPLHRVVIEGDAEHAAVSGCLRLVIVILAVVVVDDRQLR